jgi:hypothetical protein
MMDVLLLFTQELGADGVERITPEFVLALHEL